MLSRAGRRHPIAGVGRTVQSFSPTLRGGRAAWRHLFYLGDGTTSIFAIMPPSS